jgi:hypothetical protein
MKLRIAVGASLAAALLVGGALAADSLKSGPQVGKGVQAFNPKHCNGPDEGKSVCLV